MYTFSNLVEGGFLCVDKTDGIHDLLETLKVFFEKIPCDIAIANEKYYNSLTCVRLRRPSHRPR